MENARPPFVSISSARDLALGPSQPQTSPRPAYYRRGRKLTQTTGKDSKADAHARRQILFASLMGGNKHTATSTNNIGSPRSVLSNSEVDSDGQPDPDLDLDLTVPVGILLVRWLWHLGVLKEEQEEEPLDWSIVVARLVAEVDDGVAVAQLLLRFFRDVPALEPSDLPEARFGNWAKIQNFLAYRDLGLHNSDVAVLCEPFSDDSIDSIEAAVCVLATIYKLLFIEGRVPPIKTWRRKLPMANFYPDVNPSLTLDLNWKKYDFKEESSMPNFCLEGSPCINLDSSRQSFVTPHSKASTQKSFSGLSSPGTSSRRRVLRTKNNDTDAFSGLSSTSKELDSQSPSGGTFTARPSTGILPGSKVSLKPMSSHSSSYSSRGRSTTKFPLWHIDHHSAKPQKDSFEYLGRNSPRRNLQSLKQGSSLRLSAPVKPRTVQTSELFGKIEFTSTTKRKASKPPLPVKVLHAKALDNERRKKQEDGSLRFVQPFDGMDPEVDTHPILRAFQRSIQGRVNVSAKVKFKGQSSKQTAFVKQRDLTHGSSTRAWTVDFKKKKKRVPAPCRLNLQPIGIS